MRGVIVATARGFCANDGPHQRLLREAGYELRLLAPKAPLDAAALADALAEADAAILGLDRCTAEVFERAPRLRVVSRHGVGLDSVDLEAAARHGVAVANTPGANTVAVAELVFGLLLALARGLPDSVQAVRDGGWPHRLGWELAGRRLGLLGLGQIGRAVAQRAMAFGMRVLAHDPYAPELPGVTRLGLDELFQQADVLSLHLSLNPATRHIVDARRLALLPPGAVLINTARGGLVDEAALAAALRQGRLAGAAADAFEREPPTDSPLLALPNFLPTPHLGAATLESTLRMAETAARNALAVLRGEPCPHLVVPPAEGHARS